MFTTNNHFPPPRYYTHSRFVSTWHASVYVRMGRRLVPDRICKRLFPPALQNILPGDGGALFIRPQRRIPDARTPPRRSGAYLYFRGAGQLHAPPPAKAHSVSENAGGFCACAASAGSRVSSMSPHLPRRPVFISKAPDKGGDGGRVKAKPAEGFNQTDRQSNINGLLRGS